VLKSADAQIASAALHNTLGVHDAFAHINEDMQARIDNFKLLNKAEWVFMYEASSWLVTSI